MILLMRLQEAGAGERICPSQFGFRRNRSTEGALHCARRAIEKAWAHRGGTAHLMALDWAKAFDSINSESLILALRRFELPRSLTSAELCQTYGARALEYARAAHCLRSYSLSL